MKYILYITTNLKNNKVYIGVHKTNKPHEFDGYIGNGVTIPKNKESFKIKDPVTPFQKAVNKYGYKNFIRSIIYIFDIEEDAYKVESLIVDECFIESKHSYNVALGGKKPTPNFRSVNQYAADGQYIKTWNSLTEACTHYDITSGCIIDSCTERSITAAGSVWRYNTDNLFSDIEVRHRLPSNKGEVNAISVVQYSKSGYRKRTFRSIAQAAKHLNIPQQDISACCLGNKTAGGYQWRYESDKIFELPKVIPQTESKEIEQLLNDGAVSRVYKNAKEAALDIRFPKSARGIRKACSTGSKFKGYYWRFKG